MLKLALAEMYAQGVFSQYMAMENSVFDRAARTDPDPRYM